MIDADFQEDVWPKAADEFRERLRRYLPRRVEVSADAAALRLSGQARIAQAEDFVRALPSAVPVRARLEEGRWRITAR